MTTHNDYLTDDELSARIPLTVFTIDESGAEPTNVELPPDADSAEVYVATSPDAEDLLSWAIESFQRNGPLRLLQLCANDRPHIKTWLLWSADGSSILPEVVQDYVELFDMLTADSLPLPRSTRLLVLLDEAMIKASETDDWTEVGRLTEQYRTLTGEDPER